MTYWHMQLHPKDDLNWNREEELLNKKGLIGIDGEMSYSQRIQFTDSMQRNDIVLIKRGTQLIALVQVVGECEDHSSDDDSLDWFSLKRAIKVLDWSSAKIEEKLSNVAPNFRLPAVRLSKSINKDSKVYQFIDDWYLSLQQKQYNQESLIPDDYKISNIYINNFKMFKNFTLNLAGIGNKPLPLIVLAGKNGTGKTSILEYLSDYNLNEGDFIEIFKTKKAEGMDAFIEDDEIIVDSFKLFKSMVGILEKKSEYKNHILYLPVEINKIEKVEDTIVNYYISMGVVKDLRPSEIISELQKFITDIFNEDFGLSFTISRIAIQTRQVFFENNNGKEVSINELSTGEKTLLSKILYLYFNDAKNQIILIDEPELSLHPAWQNRVLKLYENFAINNNCQIIIATHSPHIIGSAKNESIRVLQKNGEGKIEALDHFSQSYGLEFHKILTEIMGVEYLRTPEVAEKLATLKKMIAQNRFDTSEFQEKWQELEEIFGDNYLDLKLLKLEIASRKKSVLHHEK